MFKGILQDCGSDGSMFKGIFIRYLGQLYFHVDPSHQQQYLHFIEKNSDSIWTRDRSQNRFGLYWEGPYVGSDDELVFLPTQLSALDAFNAALQVCSASDYV